MRRRGTEPASTSLFPPLAVRPCGGWQGETGNRGGTRRPLSRGAALGSAGGTRDGLLRRHATGRIQFFLPLSIARFRLGGVAVAWRLD